MGTLLDAIFGASDNRPNRINRAVDDAVEGKKVVKPTLGQPEGQVVEETAAMKRKKKRKTRVARQGSSLSSAVRSVT